MDLEEALAECEDFLSRDNYMGGARGSPLHCLSCKRPADDHAPKCRLKWALMVPPLARALADRADLAHYLAVAMQPGKAHSEKFEDCENGGCRDARQALAAFVQAVREARGG